MSRGAGRIERAIRGLFDAHPDLAFVTEELVRHCFPNAEASERKHQVSVLRAAHKVVAADPDWTSRRTNHQGGGWVFFNRANVQSYALYHLIIDRISHDIYQSPKRARRRIGHVDRMLMNEQEVPPGWERITKNGMPYMRRWLDGQDRVIGRD